MTEELKGHCSHKSNVGTYENPIWGEVKFVKEHPLDKNSGCKCSDYRDRKDKKKERYIILEDVF